MLSEYNSQLCYFHFNLSAVYLYVENERAEVICKKIERIIWLSERDVHGTVVEGKLHVANRE